jgi:hypothetical protein
MRETIKALNFRFQVKSQLLGYINSIESDPKKWNCPERYARHLLIKKEVEDEIKDIRRELENLKNQK